MTETIQPSFSAGEMAPATYARVDLARYYTGLKTCRNFLVMPEGGVRNRAGTEFVAEAKFRDRKCRLIPFQFSTEQTYILEFGHQYIRFFTNGGALVNGLVVYEIASPYVEADLFQLNYTQSADVLTIAHPNYAPRDLKRLGATNWTLTEISFVPAISSPAGLTATPRADGSGATSQYRYKVTAVSTDESAEESLPSEPASVNSWDSKAGAELSWSAVAGADHYNVYKENNGSGIFGFIGQADGTTFTDNNINPEKDDTPPSGDNPFANGNNPGVVGYYQQRLVFAASNSQPQTVWMSRTGAFHNFGYSTPSKDDDAITLTIASRQVNRIRHLVPLRELLLLTSGAEWTLSGDNSGLTATNVQVQVQSYIGASTVPPAVYGNTALYVQARGQKLADLAYSYTSDGFQGQDLTVLSSHLVRGYEVQDMTLAQVPNSCLWMVRNDGTLLGFTYLPTQEVFSWHRHDTQGKFESIASVPEGDEDAVYVVVNRTIQGTQRRYIERMASRQLAVAGRDTKLDRCIFLDSCLSYDGRSEVNVTLTGGTDWKYPEQLTLNSVSSIFPSTSVGETYILIGADGERVRVVNKGWINGYSVTVEPQSIVPESLRGVQSSTWGVAQQVLKGLEHLEGETVSIFADGNVIEPIQVVNGAITLPQPGVLVRAGLPFVSDFQTLDLTAQNQPNLLGNRKRLNGVTILCEESRGVFAGATGGKLYEYKQRADEDYNDPIPLQTGRIQIDFNGAWGDGGNLFIRQTDPLPLTILGVLPNVQTGG